MKPKPTKTKKPRPPRPAKIVPVLKVLTQKQLEKADQRRLQQNLNIHLGLVKGRPLRMFEVEELVRRKMVPGSESSGTPNITGGFRGVANYINNNFRLTVSHTSIQNWMRGTTLPSGCRENFPASEASGSNRWKKDAVDGWVRRYLLTTDGQQSPVVDDNLSRQQKADADMAEMKARAMHKKLSGLYTLTEIHERTLTACGIEARNLTRETMEKKLPKRFGSGLGLLVPDVEQMEKVMTKLQADCVTIFGEWQRQMAATIDNLVVQSKPVMEVENV